MNIGVHELHDSCCLMGEKALHLANPVFDWKHMFARASRLGLSPHVLFCQRGLIASNKALLKEAKVSCLLREKGSNNMLLLS